jgi:hypothetical protein
MLKTSPQCFSDKPSISEIGMMMPHFGFAVL